LALEQGPQPALVLRRAGEELEQLHIAGVGRAAVEDFGRPGHPSHQLGERCVLHMQEAEAGLVLAEARQEEVPELLGFGVGLEIGEEGRWVLARRDRAMPVGYDRQYPALEKVGDPTLQLERALRVGEVHMVSSVGPIIGLHAPGWLDPWQGDGRRRGGALCGGFPGLYRRSDRGRWLKNPGVGS